jgi:hypothetical protein
MKKILNSNEDINALSEELQDGVKESKIKRIEDLPDIEQVAGDDIEWLVDGVFARGALHMITSEPGGGKSTLITAVADAVSRGEPFMGRTTVKCPVLLLDAENPLTAIRERFKRLGIATHANFRVWGQWVGEDPPSAGGAVVWEWVARCEPKPVIIVDSVIAFHPGTENDSNETRQYMATYRNLTKVGVTVIVLHHIGKSETAKEYRGSSDYKASIDIGFKLTNLGDAARLSVLELRPFKQRFSVDPMLLIEYDNGVFSANRTAPTKNPTDQLRTLLKARPAISKRNFEALAAGEGLSRSSAREFLEQGIAAKTIRLQIVGKNQHLHSWIGKDSE